MRNRTVIATTLALLVGACGETPQPTAEAGAAAQRPTAPTAAQTDTATPEPAPPAEASQAEGSLRVDLPAEGAISLAGFGPAKFGASAEEVRMAWGGEFEEAKPSEPGGCYYLMPQRPANQGYKIAFMIEGDRFVRIDVASDEITAPGGGRIGMSADELQKLYKDALQPMPHKYTEGAQYLSIAASGVAPSKLVYETGADGKVDEWRVGLTPQVDYVEGCS